MTEPPALTQVNFEHLSQNPYPGRGIVAGLDETEEFLVQVYWIMGRSDNSRNSLFCVDGTRLYTEAADPSKVTDPSLIIYNAMKENGPHYVVSNGSQTDTVIENASSRPPCLPMLLGDHVYEPDEPNFTQRITAMSSFMSEGRSFLQMSILRKSALGESCDQLACTYDRLYPGFGFCITTYAGDGDPLPPFRGEPLLMPLTGNIEEIAREYWSALNEENRVALAVKSVRRRDGRSSIHIVNKYEKYERQNVSELASTRHD